MNKKFNAYDFFIDERNINLANGNNYMILSEKEKITYNEFHENITKKYKFFFDEINDCSCLGILLPDSIFQQILFWGAMKHEITPALFSVNEILDSVIRIIKSAHIDVMVSDETHRKFLAAVSRCCNLCRAYIIDKDGKLELIWYNEKQQKKKKNATFILFSSGTTGISKGIIHNQYDMKYAAETYGKQVLGLTNKDIIYSMAHLNYGFAFTNSTFQAVYGGAATIIDESTDIWTIIENINKFRPTVLCGVPVLFEALERITEKSSIDLSSVRLALSSGEKMPECLWDIWYDKFHIPIIEGYGSVEMLTNVISNRQDDYCKGSSGKLLEGYEAKIEKINTDDGEFVGVLSIKGDSVSNYTLEMNNEKSNIYKTNDVFRVDNDGFFWYEGRIDNICKVNGLWFNPLIIEKYLESIAYIRYALVVNVNMNIVAYIVVDDTLSLNYDDVKEINYWLKHDKNQTICPYKYVIVKDLPRNNNGKKIRIKPDSKDIIKEIEV